MSEKIKLAGFLIVFQSGPKMDCLPATKWNVNIVIYLQVIYLQVCEVFLHRQFVFCFFEGVQNVWTDPNLKLKLTFSHFSIMN